MPHLQVTVLLVYNSWEQGLLTFKARDLLQSNLSFFRVYRGNDHTVSFNILLAPLTYGVEYALEFPFCQHLICIY